MEFKAIDPDDFRQAQHKNWDSAAVGWNEWSEFNARADRHISERLVELAGVEPGSRVLDVAAGYGEPALTAARKAGPEGRVVATDISAEMLAFGLSARPDAETAAGLSIPMRTTMERLDVPAPPAGTPGPLSGLLSRPSAGCSKEAGSRTSPWSRPRSPSSSTPRRTSPPTSGRSPLRSGR